MDNDQLKDNLIRLVTHLGDNNLILGHRISEWCGHGPVLEQDIALTNIALDLIGQARMYYQYAAELTGGNATEDSIAYLRVEREYSNYLLCERPNGDFGTTIARQFIYDSWHYFFLHALQNSADKQLAAIAEKSIKEVAYHKRYSSEWLIRLGDGTSESHVRVQTSINDLWKYAEEMFEPAAFENIAISNNIYPRPALLKEQIDSFRLEILNSATLTKPEVSYFQTGGKTGIHSEYLGHILSELQYVQRAYPGLEW